ncbi:MAG TPA: hypothetical protein PLL33_14335 [Paracoccus sp. (in: a-proteobacteria)]|nr:hypothetical protein [Paracoccus sp. (in: a-proteobacteria)]
MQVAIHFGTHGTEPERMIKTLMDNRDWLLANGVEVVPPGRCRGVLDEAINSLQGGTATPAMEEVLYDALLENDDVRRMIISQPALIGSPVRCIASRGFFQQAGNRMRSVANLFPDAEVELSLAIRNPALQIPWLVERSGAEGLDKIADVDPLTLRWAPAMRRVIESNPGRRVVVWCYEDTPLIWPECVRRIAQMPPNVPLKAGLAVLGELLTPEGMAELRDTLTRTRSLTIEARRDIFADMLARHVRMDQVQAHADIPGWTQDLVDEITEAYEADVAEIAALPGVEFIGP